MNLEVLFFYLLGALALASAVLMITRRNPVASVIFLILNFFALAGLYLMLHAQFIAVIQIIVYAGAIMVLFLFAVMLLRLADESQLSEKMTYRKAIAAGLAFGLFLQIAYVIGIHGGGKFETQAENAAAIGTVEAIGMELFTNYLFPFEVISIILLAAIVGAIVLAKKRFE